MFYVFVSPTEDECPAQRVQRFKRSTKNIIYAYYTLKVDGGRLGDDPDGIVSKLVNEILDVVVLFLNTTTIITGGVFDQDYFHNEINSENFRKQIQEPSCENVHMDCPLGHKCDILNNSLPVCRSLCAVEGAPNCGDNGVCAIDTNTGNAICRCISLDDFHISGDRCEIKTEKYFLNKSEIMGIGLGVGGAVLFIGLIIVVALCCKLRKMSRKDKYNEPRLGYLMDLSEDKQKRGFMGSNSDVELHRMYGEYVVSDKGDENSREHQAICNQAYSSDELTTKETTFTNDNSYQYVDEKTLMENLQKLDPWRMYVCQILS
ncbi:uncharacterized protein LOC135464337 [Liolophura sinensis]|uniref:uncharacterized protein LOC135464337 n=1 Tax=Liolophura sinensis TaxID=3198878 RepID=UPI0031591B71